MGELNGRVLFIREREFAPNNLINFGLGVIATIVSKRFHVKVIDNCSRYVTYSIDDIIKIIKTFKPDVIGFSIITTNAYSSYQTIAAVKKEFPELPIIAGGHHVGNKYKEALEHKIDYAVRGEAELVIIPLIESVINNRRNKSERNKINIEGVSYYFKNELVSGGICPYPTDLDSISIVDFGLYNLSDYIKDESDKTVLGWMLFQRGCPYKCTFCSDQFTRAKVRKRSVDNIINDIEDRHKSFGLDIIHLADADFTLSEKRVIEFCEAIINRGLNKKLNFLVQSDCYKPIKKLTFELMKEAGFHYISFGIERMEEETQKKINKVLKKDTIFENLKNAKEAGFVIQINFLVGFPFETIELLEKENSHFKKLLEEYADIISVGILMPMPGTIDYENYKDTIGEWYLNPLLFPKYQPVYLKVRDLIYDPNIINVYSFNREVNKKMLASKSYFRGESIKKKSRILFVLYKTALSFSKISEIIYRINPAVEYKLAGKPAQKIVSIKENIRLKWYRRN